MQPPGCVAASRTAAALVGRPIATRTSALPAGVAPAKPRVTAKDPVGLTYAKMTDAQKATLWKLMEAYANRATGEAAEDELKRAKDAGLDKVHFAFWGGLQPREPYTYRIQGPTFVVEFLNVQNDSAGNKANHIHSAWRSLKNDFGLMTR